jgi:ABC-type proline/glycine betaine transport system permease subunit
MVGASVCLLTLAFTATTLVEAWYPPPLGARLVAGARTLAVASGLVAAGAGYLGGGGLGAAILDAARLQAYGPLCQGLLLILGLALVLDLALGFVQMLALRSKGDGAEAALLGRTR